MQTFDLSKELSSKLTKKRMRTWRWTTAVSNIPKGAVVQFSPIKPPRLGDVALVQVTQIGAHSTIEQASGSCLSIFPGSVLVGAFADRYAPDEFEGHIPTELAEGEEIDLLNFGGTLGKVVAGNSAVGTPTKVKLLSFLMDKEGNIANTLNYSKKPATPRKNSHIELIIVTGTSMNSGKSNTAKAIIYSLTSAGETVLAAKVTGTAAKKDCLLMKTAGAYEACDFIDFGYPSTYRIGQEKVVELFWKTYHYLASKVEKKAYMVIEIADGLFQREAEYLLADQDIRSITNHVVFSCCDSLSAIAGVNTLKEKYGINVSAISGPSANSPLGLNEVHRFLPNLPAFNNMVLDVESTARIFRDNKPEISLLPETIMP